MRQFIFHYLEIGSNRLNLFELQYVKSLAMVTDRVSVLPCVLKDYNPIRFVVNHCSISRDILVGIHKKGLLHDILAVTLWLCCRPPCWQ